ncbi:MAG: DUF1285 domain-containing protein [Luminiphilus sp.]|jgi:uncharacterized protein|nr:DUF1285 domain-containing protein [Luminiphilus sp.]
MAADSLDENNRLHTLLGNVPDKAHNRLRDPIASINGRRPAPLQDWHPENCGDIDMAISAEGTWYHEGVAIRRTELWQLFAGILRREADGHYYLVTPVEKCRVSVALHPLIITDIEPQSDPQGAVLMASLNAGGVFPISAAYPIALEPRASGAAYISLPQGLSALCSRAAWYRLVAMAGDDNVIASGGVRFPLS